MPYIIHVPQIPRPYITNNPSIFIDGQSWNWDVESRPYDDSFCKAIRRRENARFEGDRRADQLELFWMTEVERRQRLKDAETKVERTVVELGAEKEITQVPTHGKHIKNDSVHGILAFMQRRGPLIQVVEVAASDA